ncbi:MAG: hypothetical protein RIE58_12805 [Vicingaceae bacterium]
MKAASITEIKKELSELEKGEMLDLCLRLSKFKKENKELLSYLLFESFDEAAFVTKVKNECDELFEQINRSSYYFIKKSIRKILRNIKKHIRYSNEKTTEAELLIYFCQKMRDFEPSLKNSAPMKNLFDRQLDGINKALSSIHEDLRYDYHESIESLSL